ncbi:MULTISPECIES: hypothetical protein [Natrialba]|nr:MULTISPECIES: hypothetical protein [Natrialba]
MCQYQCPNCLEEAGVERCREVTADGLERTFVCRNCEYEWTVIF